MLETPDNRRRGGDEANKPSKKKRKKHHGTESIRSSAVFTSQSSIRTNESVPKSKKPKTDRGMQRHPLPDRLRSPQSPTRSTPKSTTKRPNMAAQSTTPSLAVQSPVVAQKPSPAIPTNPTSSTASTKQFAPLKTDSTAAPPTTSQQLVNRQRSPSPEVQEISERSFQQVHQPIDQAKRVGPELRKAKEELRNVKSQYSKTKKELRDEKLESSRVKQELEEKIKTLEAKSEAFCKDNERLVGEKAALQKINVDQKTVSDAVRAKNVQDNDTIRTHAASRDLLDKRVNELCTENKNQATKIKGLESANNSLTSENKDLLAENSKFSRQISIRATKVVELESAHSSLTAEHKDALAKVAALEAELEAELDTLSGELRDRDEKISTLKNCEKGLHLDIQKLTANEQILRAGKSVLTKDNDKLIGDLSSCQSNVEKCEAEKTKLEDILATKEALLEEQAMEIAKHEQRIANLEDGEQKTLDTILRQSEMLTEKQMRIAELDKAQQVSRGNVIKGNAKVTEQQRRIADLEKAQQVSRENAVRQSNFIMEQRQQITQAEVVQKASRERVLNQTMKITEQHLQKVTKQQQQISGLEQYGRESRNHLFEAEAKLLESGRILEEKTSELNESNALCAQYIKDLGEKNDNLAVLEKKIGELRTDLDLKSHELDARQGEVDQLQQEIKACKGSLATSKHDCDRLRQEQGDTMSYAKDKAAEISSLQERISDLTSHRDRALLQAQTPTIVPTKSDVAILPISKADAYPATSFSFEDQNVLYQAYERIPDPRFQLRYNGWIAPRRPYREEWIGTFQAAEILNIDCDEDREAFIAPYKAITDRRLEILVDGKVLPRGIEALPPLQEERHTLEDAGVSIADGGAQCSTFGNTARAMSPHGEPSRRDIALEKKAALELEARSGERLSVPQHEQRERDPRLRARLTVSIPTPVSMLAAMSTPAVSTPAPVAVMVAPKPQAKTPVQSISQAKEATRPYSTPEKPVTTQPGPQAREAMKLHSQPEGSGKEPLRRVSTDLVSEADSLQTPALTHDENMSPNDTGPITPRSPVPPLQSSVVPGTLKRKEPMEPLDVNTLATRQSKEPATSFDPRKRRAESEESRNKRQRTADVQDPTERAPRGPRRFRESAEAFRDSRAEHDVYPRSRREDGPRDPYSSRAEDDRRASYAASDAYWRLGPTEGRDSRYAGYDSYKPTGRQDSGRRSPDYGPNSGRARR